MKKVSWAAATVGAMLSMSAPAAPVSLGTIEHLYGSAGGRQLASISSVYHPGGNCDTVNAASITVRATSASSCNRFADIFDFSDIDYASITSFSVTLAFTGARDGLERWNVRAASNYVQSATTFGATLNASGSQTFAFNNSMALFSDIVSNEDFVLSFAQTGLGGATSNFNLASARVELFGTAAAGQLPEPGSLALASLSLIAVGVACRRSATARRSIA